MNTYEITPNLTFYYSNDLERYRCESFWEKEPETIEWIKSFDDGDTFFDVGANIGIYALYVASLYPKSRVYAFEPMPINYVRLIQNMKLNGLENVVCFNMALDTRCHIDNVYVQDNQYGNTGTQIHEPRDEHGKFFEPVAVYPIPHVSLDFLNIMYKFHHVDHVKIDVDGRENNVVAGMIGLIKDRKIKSFLVEINTNQTDVVKMTHIFERCGYTPDNEFNIMSNHSNNRRGGNPVNMVFTRKDI